MPEDTFALMDDFEPQVPAGMSALMQLTSLDVCLCGGSLDELKHSWLGLFSALQHLGLHTQKEGKLPVELTALTRLTELCLSTSSANPEEERNCMGFQFNWHGMCALKRLTISSGLYAFDSHFLQLVCCNSLEAVYFVEVRVDSAESAKFLGALMSSKTTRYSLLFGPYGHVLVAELLEQH